MKRLLSSFTLVTAIFSGTVGQAGPLTLSNPDWLITLTDYGYSDILLDSGGLIPTRELLSGEWAGAVTYTQGGPPVSPMWLEPSFIAPIWTTNSTFTVVTPITSLGVNGAGLPIAESLIKSLDSKLGIHIRYEMLDTGVGIKEGFEPKSVGGPGVALTSSRYILNQRYTLTNLSATEPITDLQFFQFLHGLNSLVGIYDDRTYGGPFPAYHYDTTLRGVDPQGPGFDDVLSFHSAVAPTDWEIGRYGIIGIDSHVSGKPSVGTHLSVEANALSGSDFFDPTPDLWIGGAQRHDLPDIAPMASVSIDYMLSINATQLPEPNALALAILGSTALFVGWRGHRRACSLSVDESESRTRRS